MFYSSHRNALGDDIKWLNWAMSRFASIADTDAGIDRKTFKKSLDIRNVSDQTVLGICINNACLRPDDARGDQKPKTFFGLTIEIVFSMLGQTKGLLRDYAYWTHRED